MQNIEIGQGFVSHGRLGDVYGLIIDASDKDVFWYPVRDAHGFYLLSYDDDGANPDKDKNHVRLKDAPPPFSEFGICYNKNEKVSNAMVFADSLCVYEMSIDVFEKYCSILDGGAVISPNDMKRVFNHPFPQQMELQKTMSRVDRVEAMFGYISRDDGGLERDKEYGD